MEKACRPAQGNYLETVQSGVHTSKKLFFQQLCGSVGLVIARVDLEERSNVYNNLDNGKHFFASVDTKNLLKVLLNLFTFVVYFHRVAHNAMNDLCDSWRTRFVHTTTCECYMCVCACVWISESCLEFMYLTFKLLFQA